MAVCRRLQSKYEHWQELCLLWESQTSTFYEGGFFQLDWIGLDWLAGTGTSLHFVRILLTRLANYVASPWIDCKDILTSLLVCLFPLVLWCSKHQTLSEWRGHGSGIDETYGRHFSTDNIGCCPKPRFQKRLEILQHHTFSGNYWG